MRSELTDPRPFSNVVDAGTITSGARASRMASASAGERSRTAEAGLAVVLPKPGAEVA